MLAPKDSKLDRVSPCYFFRKKKKRDVKEYCRTQQSACSDDT